PVDGDRIMITAPSFEDPSDTHFFNGSELIDIFAKPADIIIVGGYLHYAGKLQEVLNEVHETDERTKVVFTLAAQGIAAEINKSELQDLGNTTIHGNTDEFRRHMRMDTQWRERFAHNFIGRDGK